MFTFESLLYILTALICFLILFYFLQLKRKCDRQCFAIGYYVGVIFFYLVIYSLIIGRFDLLPEIISAAIIAMLTLAFVWVELSKRPELKISGFAPIIYKKNTTEIGYKAGFHNEPVSKSFTSKLLRIRQVSYEGYRFDEQLAFSFDLANLGYEEIMVHEYVYFLDGKRQSPVPLGSPPYDERLRLTAQQRYCIDLTALHIQKAGFHRITVSVCAATEICSKGCWFFVTEDFQKLRYVEVMPIKQLLTSLIKKELQKDQCTTGDLSKDSEK